MAQLTVPVVLFVVTSLVPTGDAFSRIPICKPPSPLSCVFPWRDVCVHDKTQDEDVWFCENIFTGTQKVAPTRKPFSLKIEPTDTDLKGHGFLHGLLSLFKNSKSVAQNKKVVKKPSDPLDVSRSQRTQESPDVTYSLDSSDLTSTNSLPQTRSSSAPGVGFYSPYSARHSALQIPHFYHLVQSPYNSNMYYSRGLPYLG